MTYDSVAETKTYAQVFGCPILFGQKENTLVLDKRWLDGPFILGNEITYREVLKLCDQLMNDMRLKMGVAGSVREALLINLAQPMSFNAVARRLKISRRTLKRRLREEDASYRKIADELRTQLAIKYLRDTQLSIDDIAPASHSVTQLVFGTRFGVGQRRRRANSDKRIDSVSNPPRKIFD